MAFSYLVGIDSHVNELEKQLNENSNEKTAAVNI
jgi:hypothetical protein